MAFITIKTDSAQAEQKIEALISAAGNLQPLYETIGRTLLNRVRLCFKMGVNPWGDPWLPIKWRAARTRSDGTRTRTGRRQSAANAAGKPGEPLRDTGVLNRSISSQVDSGGVTVGTNVLYARTHQFGATITPKRARRLVFPGPNGELIFAKKVVIPARPFLPIRGADVDLPQQWSDLVVRNITGHFRQAVKGQANA